MATLKTCDSYPCYEYRVLGWKIDKDKLRRRHSTHGVVITSEPFVKGTFLRSTSEQFKSLVHNGKKRK